MHLPNYFLADLPPEATLTPMMLSEACAALKRNRAQYLVTRTTAEVIGTIADVAREWLTPTYPFRQLALAEVPGKLPFSSTTLERGLDQFFRQLTAENLEQLHTEEK